MSISSGWIQRQVGSCLVVLLALPFGLVTTAWPQQTLPGQRAEGAAYIQAPQPPNSESATDKPSVDKRQSETSHAALESAGSQTIDHNQPAATSSSPSEAQQNSTSKPVGTAAAPYEKTTGVAASRPSGAAIAPAKQRRARSILIKVGVLVGAAVAVGTVVALSSASPSRPN